MVMVKNPFFSLDAHGSFGKLLTVRRNYGRHVIQKFPSYKYNCSADQLKERDRMRRLNVIRKWYKDSGTVERITEIRPEIVLDPLGPIYYFDMSCFDIAFGNLGLDIGLGTFETGWSVRDDHWQGLKDDYEGGLIK